MTTSGFFVDTSYAAISQDCFSEYFNKDKVHPNLRVNLLPKYNPNSEKRDPKTIPLEEYKNYGQDDPIWHLLRAQPKMIPASGLAEMIGMHDKGIGELLDVTDTMFANPRKECSKWMLYKMRLKYEHVPSWQEDAIMATFCQNGKNKEGNAIAVFLYKHPHVKYYDQGLTVITDAILDRLKLVNRLTKEPIKKLPFILGASPDGIIKWTDSLGIEHRCIIECKARITMIPGDDAETLPGLSWKVNPNIGPYKHIKGYYIFQVMTQLAATETQTAYWMNYTYNKGMPVWVVDFDIDFFEMMVTILIFMCENISNDQYPNLTFPGFFLSEECPEPLKKIHSDLVKRANAIVNMSSMSSRSECSVLEDTDYGGGIRKQQKLTITNAREYAYYKDTKEIVNEILGVTETNKLTVKTYTLPNHPPETPSFSLLHAMGMALEVSGLEPVSHSANTEARIANLRTFVRECKWTRFCEPVVEVMLGLKMGINEYDEFVTVIGRKCKTAELYICDVCKHVLNAREKEVNELLLEKIMEVTELLEKEYGDKKPRLLDEIKGKENDVDLFMRLCTSTLYIITLTKKTPEIKLDHIPWFMHVTAINIYKEKMIDLDSSESVFARYMTIAFLHNILIK